MTPRPGRNDPCHCGSGKKYKRCCIDSDRQREREIAAELPAAMEQFARQQAERMETERRLREEYGIFIDFVWPVEHQGRMVRALGQRLYPARPLTETYHEFIIFVLRREMGGEWWAEQQALAPAERHFLARCFEAYDEWRIANANPENVGEEGRYHVAGNGWVQSLISIAWDVAALIQVGAFPDELLARLRHADQFQGSRYEVAIGGIFARLNCEIAWRDGDNQNAGRRVEFIATHRATNTTVAVEAKSRHRAGVLNEPGERAVDPLDGDFKSVRRLFLKALKKKPDEPLVIFIDVNAPVALQEGDMARWQAEALRWMGRVRAAPAAMPGPFTSLYMTNFSPHYSEGDIARGHEWMVLPSDDAEPLPDDFARGLVIALQAYAHIPEFREGGQIAAW